MQMLKNARFRCLLNAHVLQHHFKLEERALDITLMTKLRKDAGKIVQRTMGRGKKQDPFIYKEEDYAKQGIGVVVNLVRIYGDGVFGLRDIGLRKICLCRVGVE